VSIISPFRLTLKMWSRPFLIAAGLLTVVATVWPGVSLPWRLATPFLAFLIVAAPYYVLRIYLEKLVRVNGQRTFGYYYTVLIYYMGIGGAISYVILAPFELAKPVVSGASHAVVLLGALGCIGAAIAATEVADGSAWRPNKSLERTRGR
jgi:hypothetical protein